jgi:hypothetical protein
MAGAVIEREREKRHCGAGLILNWAEGVTEKKRKRL